MVSEIAWCLCRFPEIWDHSLKKVGLLLLLIVFKVSQPNYFLNIVAKECFLTTSCFYKDRISMLEEYGFGWLSFSNPCSRAHSKMVSSFSPSASSNKGKFVSCQGLQLPFFPAPAFPLCSLACLLFCGWNGQRNQNQSRRFPLPCIQCCISVSLQKEV